MPFFDYQANILPNFDIFKRPQFHSTPKYNIIIWVSQELKWFSNRKLREDYTEFCILATKCIQKCHFWRFGLILSQIGQMHRSSYRSVSCRKNTPTPIFARYLRYTKKMLHTKNQVLKTWGTGSEDAFFVFYCLKGRKQQKNSENTVFNFFGPFKWVFMKNR